MNGVLDESGTIVSDLKRITDLMNKNFVNIAEKLLNERKDAYCNNLEFCFSSVCKDFVFKEFTISEIEMYIRNMRKIKKVPFWTICLLLRVPNFSNMFSL